MICQLRHQKTFTELGCACKDIRSRIEQAEDEGLWAELCDIRDRLLAEMEVIRIDNLEVPRLAPYARLTEAQLLNRLHPEEGLFICESEKVIRVALAAGVKPVSFLCEEKYIDTISIYD